ncbi:MAG: class II fructose-bisphosphate aldolase family protein [Holosporales bacterium]|jgi:fructose-bisphosphate aldolase class II|nr:class II fructose-bisphosphate aldolase family protein [Holosporales bacterium]
MVFIHKNLVPAAWLLRDALHKYTAVMAFNFTNMEVIKGIISAANEAQRPVILQASQSAIGYMGMDYLRAIVYAAAEESTVPLALHLDHGSSFEICKLCIDNGFTSVMIDASSQSFDSNVAVTKSVVEYARKFGVSVEAELGILSGMEDGVNMSPRNARYTDPDEAASFTEKTGITSLAIAIGTSHGPNKGVGGNSVISLERLKQIKNKVGQFPLVLHGASSVYGDSIELCNTYGADIKEANGIDDADIRDAIKNGITKVNIDTDLRIAFTGAVRKVLETNRSVIDVRTYLGEAISAIHAMVIRRLSVLP